MVAESGDLIPHAFEGVAEPTTVDNEATGDGVGFGLVANKLDIHTLWVFSERALGATV